MKRIFWLIVLLAFASVAYAAPFTIGKIPKAKTGTYLEDSSIYETSGGNVGVGTTSPRGKLDVNGAIYGSTFFGSGAGLTGIVGGSWGSITGTLASQSDLQSALDAKVPTTRTVNSKPLSANITLGQNDIDLSLYAKLASPTFTGTVTVPTVSVTGVADSVFSTNVGIGTAIPRVKLDVDGTIYASGNIGIKTTSPRGALDVVGAASIVTIDGYVYEGYAGSTNYNQAQHGIKALADSATQPVLAVFNSAGGQIMQIYSTAGQDGEMRFRDDTSTTRTSFNAGSTNYITSQSSTGYIGLGTTSPGTGVDVGGYTRTFGAASKDNIGVKGTIEVDGAAYIATGYSSGQAVCWHSTGRLGYCSTTPTNGTCTCN